MMEEQSVPMLTRRFKEQTVGGAGLSRSRGGNEPPRAIERSSKTSIFTAASNSYFPSFQTFRSSSFPLFLLRDQSLSQELHRLKHPAGGRDLRVPNPQRRVGFKGPVI